MSFGFYLSNVKGEFVLSSQDFKKFSDKLISVSVRFGYQVSCVPFLVGPAIPRAKCRNSFKIVA